MTQDSTGTHPRQWYDSSHASLCLLGMHLQQLKFFDPIEERVHIHQKVCTYTPTQKLEMLMVGMLAGTKAVAHMNLAVRPDRALCTAFGLPGCAEQSVLADTLDAATTDDVSALRDAIGDIFARHSQARQHDYQHARLVLDVDLSPLPASARAEGSARGYMGRCRSKTGRKLVRVRAAQYQETVWEDVIRGNMIEHLEVLQNAVQNAERRLGLDGDDAAPRAKRAQTEIRIDSGWGSDKVITWLLERGYQVTGKFRSAARVKKLVATIDHWAATSSPGREVAVVPAPIAYSRPVVQYAVRTPAKDKPGGYASAVVFTSCTERSMADVIAAYDGRAGMESDLKGDKHGLGLATMRKGRYAAQVLVILLQELAHNVLVWARRWLSEGAPRLRPLGIVRLIQEVWTVPGRVRIIKNQVQRVRLRREHPRAHDVWHGFRALLPKRDHGSGSLVILG